MSKFWKVFMVLNGAAIVFLIGAMIWAAFDVHNRMPFALLAQIPPLLMMGIRRTFRG